LLRNFTQNIDTLEEVASINRVVYCHGSFATATCLHCRRKYNVDELAERMAKASVPFCGKCDGEDEAVIKPDIVFFGEPLPKAFDEHLDEDTATTDLLIVIGSSLKVQPVSMIPDLLDPAVPQILINRERLDHNFDIELLGDADGIVCELARRLGWRQLGETMVPAEGMHPVRTADPSHVHLFKGAKYGLRPEIPEAKSDESVLSEALVGDSIDITKVFPKPPQTPILSGEGNLGAEDTATADATEECC
jgi:NAD-dependent deacetylase sirtuin 1